MNRFIISLEPRAYCYQEYEVIALSAGDAIAFLREALEKQAKGNTFDLGEIAMGFRNRAVSGPYPTKETEQSWRRLG